MLREVAEYPNSFGPLGPNDERIETAPLHALPRGGLDLEHRPAAAVPAGARSTRCSPRCGRQLRERGRTQTQWEVGSSAPAGLVDALSSAGCGRRDLRGRARAHAGAAADAAGLTARQVETLEELEAAGDVQWEAFEATPEEIAEKRSCCPSVSGEPLRVRHGVWLNGEMVCTGTAAATEHGLLLYGGATAERARGRGAYRALIRARWDEAVALGTPALITQGGSMSRPILERLGFERVGEVHMLLDVFG